MDNQCKLKVLSITYLRQAKIAVLETDILEGKVFIGDTIIFNQNIIPIKGIFSHVINRTDMKNISIVLRLDVAGVKDIEIGDILTLSHK